MYLKTLKITNFRNYSNLEITLNPTINIIYGNNAQGKTNLLESIYFLGITKSHRSFIDNSLIKTNEATAYLNGILNTEEGESKLEIGLSEKKKKIKINGDEIKKTSEYISKMKIIIFVPEDLRLIKGFPAERRKFLNVEISQINTSYLIILSDYNKLLKIRNDLLKKLQKGMKIDQNYFEIITNYLIDKSIEIYKARKKFIEKLNEYAKNIYKDILDMDNFEIKYESFIETSNNIKESLKEMYKDTKSNEIRVGTTMIGPHKDDISFYLNGENLKKYGSQGQQRVAVLSLKLAELELYKTVLKETPILLLDDVFSELDDIKKNNLLKYITDDMQVIITTTELTNIEKNILSKSKKIQIEQAMIKNIDEVK